jgi:hypothetical protein
MNLSISRRHRLIVEGSFHHGTQRSLHLLDCEIIRTSFILRNGVLTRSLLRPPQLFVVLASETAVFIQLQRANATTYDAIDLAVSSHCANTAFVLSQTPETCQLDIITLTGGDCSVRISNSVVFWLPVLHRSSQCIVRRLDGGRRFAG